MAKVGRNEPCPCGSGKKYKKCCIDAGHCIICWERVKPEKFVMAEIPDSLYMHGHKSADGRYYLHKEGAGNRDGEDCFTSFVTGVLDYANAGRKNQFRAQYDVTTSRLVIVEEMTNA